jgi:3-hydroxybutyryl-CoA dehydratase
MPQTYSDERLMSYCFEELEVGMRAEYRRVVTQADVVQFAEVSGDVNPLHLDPDFAGRTMFKGPIVHGMYSAGMISAVIGTRLPGPGCVYMTQSLRFHAPVHAGDEVVASVSVVELFPQKRRARLETQCHVGDTLVVSGEALIVVPSREQLGAIAAAG